MLTPCATGRSFVLMTDCLSVMHTRGTVPGRRRPAVWLWSDVCWLLHVVGILPRFDFCFFYGHRPACQQWLTFDPACEILSHDMVINSKNPCTGGATLNLSCFLLLYFLYMIINSKNLCTGGATLNLTCFFVVVLFVCVVSHDYECRK